MQLKKIGLTALLSVTAVAFSSDLLASNLFASGTPAGWSCEGGCGVIGTGTGTVAPTPGDVVVGLNTPPLAINESSNYGFVTTAGGADGIGALAGYTSDANGDVATNGSVLTTTTFSATTGDLISFAFNFVTTDGGTFTDYAWAMLNNVTKGDSVLLFTARTSPSGDTSPGTGLPANAATLTPLATPNMGTGYVPSDLDNGNFGTGPLWTGLGNNSTGYCFDVGCGFTGWILSDYVIASASSASADLFTLSFGATNWIDESFESGLAFDNFTKNGTNIDFAIPGVPEPDSLALLCLGVAGFSFMRRFKAAV